MKKKPWIFATVIFVITFGIVIWSTPRILNMAFEKATRTLEENFIRKAPPEYSPRIYRDFDKFILAFKGNKLKREDLTKLSEVIKSANEDKELVQQEIDEILEFIETITPGLK